MNKGVKRPHLIYPDDELYKYLQQAQAWNVYLQNRLMQVVSREFEGEVVRAEARRRRQQHQAEHPLSGCGAVEVRPTGAGADDGE